MAFWFRGISHTAAFAVGVLVLLTGCPGSDTELPVSEVQQPEVKGEEAEERPGPWRDLPECLIANRGEPGFEYDSPLAIHLTVSASGRISNSEGTLWHPEEPADTGKLEEALRSSPVGRILPEGGTSGHLLVRAHRDVDYGVVALLMRIAAKPGIEVRAFDFALWDPENHRPGVLFFSSAMGVGRQPGDDDVGVLMGVRPGADGRRYTLGSQGDMHAREAELLARRGEAATDLAMVGEAVRRPLRMEGTLWFLPSEELKWEEVTTVLGEVLHGGKWSRSGDSPWALLWNDGFRMQ